MSGLLGFLLFAALFFVMMRFGCGAHAGHGGHRADRHSPDADASTDKYRGKPADPSGHRDLSA